MKCSPAFFIVAALLVCARAFAQTSAQTSAPTSLPASELARVIAEASRKKISVRHEWLRLLHYKRNLFGIMKSEAEGADFFVSPEGKRDPEAELNADLAGFFSTEKRSLRAKGVPAMSVRCQFPARWAWLNRELALENSVPRELCPEFDEFKTRTAARSVTLVFSSFHGASPSTVYGHSFLRLNKTYSAGASDHQQLLDTGLNYAANATTKNPLLYAILGLSGGFPGTFSTLPYYFKVREYSDYESRDLWEYDLALSQSEVDQLIAHVWELGPTFFKYFYLSENCSYHMLTILDAAAPRLDLEDGIPFYVVPTDTLKAVAQTSGLVRKVRYRPSVQTQFNARLARLDANERAVLKNLIETSDPQVVRRAGTPDAQAKVLDADIDFLDMRYAEDLMANNAEASAKKQALLIARSRLPSSDDPVIPMPGAEAPHLSHGSFRAFLERGESQNLGGAIGLAARFAIHDFTEAATGLPADSEIQFFNFYLRYWERDSRLALENFTLFQVASLAPLAEFERLASWRFQVGADRVYDPRCKNCTAASVKGGGGATLELLSKPRLLAYFLLDAGAAYSTGFGDGPTSLFAGPSAGLRVRLTDKIYWLTEARYRHTATAPYFEDRQLESDLRLTSPGLTWSLNARGLWTSFDREVGLALARYF